jgi:hypothetical protein
VTGDVVLQAIRRTKDKLSAARTESIDRPFAEARERQKLSGHPVVNLETKRRKARPGAGHTFAACR